MAGPFSKPKPMSPIREAVQPLFVLGTLLLMIGSGIMVGAWPETDIYQPTLLTEPVITESGSALGMFIGASMAVTGQIMIAIAIIALGVHIGNKSKVATS